MKLTAAEKRLLSQASEFEPGGGGPGFYEFLRTRRDDPSKTGIRDDLSVMTRQSLFVLPFYPFASVGMSTLRRVQGNVTHGICAIRACGRSQ
ncbi:MAG: hypothetical protein AAGG48_18190 [Planctomycetota bacterium]